jgi:hypothetical protein
LAFFSFFFIHLCINLKSMLIQKKISYHKISPKLIFFIGLQAFGRLGLSSFEAKSAEEANPNSPRRIRKTALPSEMRSRSDDEMQQLRQFAETATTEAANTAQNNAPNVSSSQFGRKPPNLKDNSKPPVEEAAEAAEEMGSEEQVVERPSSTRPIFSYLPQAERHQRPKRNADALSVKTSAIAKSTDKSPEATAQAPMENKKENFKPEEKQVVESNTAAPIMAEDSLLPPPSLPNTTTPNPTSMKTPDQNPSQNSVQSSAPRPVPKKLNVKEEITKMQEINENIDLNLVEEWVHPKDDDREFAEQKSED